MKVVENYIQFPASSSVKIINTKIWNACSAMVNYSNFSCHLNKKWICLSDCHNSDKITSYWMPLLGYKKEDIKFLKIKQYI